MHVAPPDVDSLNTDLSARDLIMQSVWFDHKQAMHFVVSISCMMMTLQSGHFGGELTPEGLAAWAPAMSNFNCWEKFETITFYLVLCPLTIEIFWYRDQRPLPIFTERQAFKWQKLTFWYCRICQLQIQNQTCVFYSICQILVSIVNFNRNVCNNFDVLSEPRRKHVRSLQRSSTNWKNIYNPLWTFQR